MMQDKVLRELGLRSRVTCPGFRLRSAFILLLVVVCLLTGLLANRTTNAANNAPLLISQPTSTRAIAMESVCYTSEPFTVTSPYAFGSDRQTRLMLFAMNLKLQPGESFSAVTADAEDAANQHYNLAVEYVGPVPNQEWLTTVVVKLNENLNSDTGDLLVQVSYGGLASNRVRIGIGHLGGGPPDDDGANPTPVKPFTVAGQVEDENNQGVDGVEVTLVDKTEGATRTIVTGNGGSYSFGDASPGHNFTVTAVSNQTFNFSTQAIEMLSGDRILDFKGARRTYTLRGKLTNPSGVELAHVLVNLTGSVVAKTASDTGGNYAFGRVPAGGNYTITVSATPYYSFTPESLNDLTENSVANFTGVLRYYTVSGRVLLGPAAVAPFLEIPISGSEDTSVTTDADGRYSISLPAGGNYTLTPSLTYYTLAPASRVITSLHSDLPNLGFTGTRQSFNISGEITDQENNGLPGITIRLTGAAQRTTVTDESGKYQFPTLRAGYNYSVTPPSTLSYTFTGHNVDDLRNDQTLDFIGLHRFTLSGRVRDQKGNGIVGITVTLSGTENSTTMTAADGSYSILATATGNYTLTPSIPQAYYDFAPSEQTFDDLGSSQATDFTATLVPVANPSYVLEFDGQPKTVDYGLFWRSNVDLGHFFWEFWAMPGNVAGGTYLLSDGYGGAHALLFGFSTLGGYEPGRYQLAGNIYDGVVPLSKFGSDQGPAQGEWGHFAVGWDGQNIITYFDGVPVGKAHFAGPRRTPGPGGGGGRLLIGGSDHSNLDGRIAQVRGFEYRNPREEAPGSVESSFAPQTVFGVDGNLLSWYFRETPKFAADLSLGHDGKTHVGSLRGTRTGILQNCVSCPPPKFVIDPSAPNFATGTPPPPVLVPTPPAVPNGALIFDSFSRANSTLLFGSNGGLGSTEGGSEGAKVWQTNQTTGSPQPFGILNARAVLLANETSLAWVPIESSLGNLDVRIERRRRGNWGSGFDTGLSFRVVDASNYFFAYTSETGGSPNIRALSLGYYLDGQRTDLASGILLPATWTTLRVVTRTSGAIDIYADGTILHSTNSPVMATVAGAGLYNNGPGLGLVNRWDNFSVFVAP